VFMTPKRIITGYDLLLCTPPYGIVN